MIRGLVAMVQKALESYSEIYYKLINNRTWIYTQATQTLQYTSLR